MPSPYLDRLLRAAMTRRSLDTLALKALVKATHLLGLALAERLRQYRDGGDPVLGRFAQLHEHTLHIALLEEALDILGSRWDKIPDRARPHYSPEARYRVLRFETILALPAPDVAHRFRVSPGTIHRREEEALREPPGPTVGSLLKPVPPVRRYCDLVRHMVQTLALAGFPGDRSLTAHLARAGLRLSRRIIQRIRKEKAVAPPPPPQATAAGRAVRARFPNHVWMMDLTEVPGFLRLFSYKLAVVLDVFSRMSLAARVFLSESSGEDVACLVLAAARRFGPPRPSVSDQGPQFTSQPFRQALGHLGVRHRYGAVGKTGSIAIIERFFRTLKAVANLHSRRPFLKADLERWLRLAFAYYVWLRPHQGLEGAAPGRSGWVPGRLTSTRSRLLTAGPEKDRHLGLRSRSDTSIPSAACLTSRGGPLRPRWRQNPAPSLTRGLRSHRPPAHLTARSIPGTLPPTPIAPLQWFAVSHHAPRVELVDRHRLVGTF
jgi:transposase InsO family protein